MPSTYNNALRLEEIANGEQSGDWGNTTNKNLGQLIVQAITGTTTLNVTSGNITLTALDGFTDEARSAVLLVTGTPGVTRVLTIPNVTKLYTVKNDTANIVQVKTASGTALDCPPLSQSFINCNGSNVVTGRSITDGANTITSAAAPFASPTFTGTVTATDITASGNISGNGITASGNIVGNGNWTIGNADTDTVTVGASFVTGSVLRSAKVATNTLALAAYDVDGAAYTNLVTLTASNTPTLALTSTGVGTINNMSIGATTASTVVATQVDITAQGDLRLQDTTGGQYVALQAPGTIATSYTLTLPVDDGTAGQALVTDGSGVLSWSTSSVATDVTVTTSTSASNFKVPFANTTVSTSGNYGLLQDSTATFTYNPSTNTLVAGIFSGALSGNATSATNATNVELTTSTAASDFKVPFANTTASTTGDYDLLQDSTATFTYNPSTNTLTAGTFAGALTGSATQLGGVAAASYAQLGTTQTFTGAKTFTGTITSGAYNLTAFTSMYGDATNLTFSVSASAVNNVMNINSSGQFSISGSDATKASGTTWINPSDARLKNNVVNYTKGLNELLQIQPKSFTFNGKAGSVAGLNAVGIIADEIESVLPDTVQKRLAKLNAGDTQETEVRYFDASELTWVMINAIKEQQAIISAMEARLAALEA